MTRNMIASFAEVAEVSVGPTQAGWQPLSCLCLMQDLRQVGMSDPFYFRGHESNMSQASILFPSL